MPDLRPLRETDVADVLALNHANVSALSPLDESRLSVLRGLADRFDVLDVDGAFAGFVLTFPLTFASSAFVTTANDDSAIAAPASIGESRMPATG